MDYSKDDYLEILETLEKLRGNPNVYSLELELLYTSKLDEIWYKLSEKDHEEIELSLSGSDD